MLAAGIPANQLLVLELNEELHAHLHARFPGVHVILGDARSLLQLAHESGYLDEGLADAIVSGLGLLTMPPSLQRDIMAAAFECLHPDGMFVQFTYGPAAPVADAVVRELGLKVLRGDFVLRNVPPATVYVYVRKVRRRRRIEVIAGTLLRRGVTGALPRRSHPVGSYRSPYMSTTMSTGNRYARAQRTLRGQATSDGAGVRLTRVIGGPMLPDLDPFLLLDEFGTDRPEDYIAGFPEHPHRGFETVTYMLDGRMRHRDNHGNEGLLTPGSVQWMTAGRGLVHSEMPEQQEGRMRGFQLWVNLPAKEKMTQPRYQEFPAEQMPVVQPAPASA